jgi:hypothetical protein
MQTVEEGVRRRFNGNPILKSVESVLKNRNINRLTKEAYEFIVLYCGSAPHYSFCSWKHAYSDIRDFVDLFLSSNECGINLEKVVRKSLGKDSPKELAIVSGTVGLCRKYRADVFNTLALEERRESVKIGKRLLRGTLSLKDILRGNVATTRSSTRFLSHYTRETNGANTRELVDELNRLLDRMDIAGIKELVRKYPKEAVAAGNYVNAKVRYVVQAIIAAEVSQLKRADREPL